VVRPGSAKPIFVGSIPTRTSNTLFQIFRCVFKGNCVYGYLRVTDKERLHAIAMNLELASIRIERTTELAERNAEAISELRAEGQAQRERLGMLSFESRALRDLVMSLATSTEQLVATDLAHQARIERLERRAGCSSRKSLGRRLPRRGSELGIDDFLKSANCLHPD
jgi:hypothetical protein